MYIPRPVIDKLWDDIVKNFKGPLSLSMDYLSEDFFNKKASFETHEKTAETLKDLGASIITGFNKISDFADAHNFKAITNDSYSDLIMKYGLNDKPVPELMDVYLTHLVGNTNELF